MTAGRWRRQAQAAFVRRCLEGNQPQTFNAERPEEVHPNNAGVAVRALADGGVIRRAGFTRSRKPSRKGGVQRRWRVGDFSKATGFLVCAEAEDPQMELPGMGGA